MGSREAGGLFLSKSYSWKLLSGLRSCRAYHESGRDSVAFWLPTPREGGHRGFYEVASQFPKTGCSKGVARKADD